MAGGRESEKQRPHVFLSTSSSHFFSLLGVFDGHSGSAAARFLVDRLYPALVSAIDESALSADECEVGDDDGDAGAAPAPAAGVCCPVTLSFALAAAFDGVDRALLSALARLRSSDPERAAGSTATVLLARPGRLVAANVGDSRAVLCRGGAAIDLTTEHRVDGPSPAAASEIGRVNAAGGWIDDGRVCGVLAVSRAFGDRGLKRPGLTTTLKQGVVDGWWDRAFADAHRSFSADPVIPTPDVTEIATSAADEFVVIASDGLWDVLSSRDACALARRALRRGEGPGGAAEALAAAAAKRRTEDNVAVVVIDLKGGEGGEGSGKAGGFFSGLFG
jgi:serine/threonine protein phosphatase PrpC